jgi:hypothetical protein
MGPQPLARVRSKAFTRIGASHLLEKPYHAAMVMGVISYAAQTENYWTYIVADLHGPALPAAAAMYQALTGAAGKRSALEAAARAKLTGTKLGMFEAIFKAWKPVALRRNDFAHHLWGACDELPDALLLVDPKDDNNFRLRIFQEVERVKKGQKRRGIGHHDTTKIQVWTPESLHQELINAGDVCQMVFDLVLALKEGPRGRTRQKLIDRLRGLRMMPAPVPPKKPVTPRPAKPSPNRGAKS